MYNELLPKLSPAMCKICQSHIVQEKESKSDKWFLLLQYLHCNINDLLITNFFLDSMSEFGGNDIQMCQLIWIRKVQDILDLNKNQFRIKLHRKTYTIPTFSKATEVNELEQQVSDMYDKSKLESAQKNAFLTQKEIVKKGSEIIFLKSELINIKNELMNTKNKLALKINEIECLGALRFALQKTKNILDSVIRGGTEKNTQSEEQSFISNSGDTSEESEIRDYASSKSLAKYFKSKNELVIKENDTLPIITNKQNPESLIQDITIEGAVCTDEALANDKYQIPPIIKIKELLQNKPEGQTKNYGSSSLFSKKISFTLPPMKLYLIDIDEANKHELIRNIGHLAILWPFSKVVSSKSGTDKTNILGNIFVVNKGECIYKKKKSRSCYIQCDDLIVCGYHPNEPKWAFVRYIYEVIASDSRVSYYENIRFKYILPEKILSIISFFPKRSTVIIFENLCIASKSIQNRIILFFTYRCHRNISPIYVMQKYHYVLIIICENITHLVIFNSGSLYEDILKIIKCYTNDVKSVSMVINSYLHKDEFIVFDLNKAEDDPLAIRLRFDTLLDLQKEIELRQKHKIKNILLAEPTS
ncbi:22452_t:CDS:2 [Cetraspora pellucida]|uniref:22452_t:CDS:1 n=1 Tax=Cetraspora pellucida TaxID=1433469 RepID=A0A9N8VQV8_9GLOM|nr:22452_t:CDS:2 [Cetraspora pellucida]